MITDENGPLSLLRKSIFSRHASVQSWWCRRREKNIRGKWMRGWWPDAPGVITSLIYRHNEPKLTATIRVTISDIGSWIRWDNEVSVISLFSLISFPAKEKSNDGHQHLVCRGRDHVYHIIIMMMTSSSFSLIYLAEDNFSLFGLLIILWSDSLLLISSFALLLELPKGPLLHASCCWWWSASLSVLLFLLLIFTSSRHVDEKRG